MGLRALVGIIALSAAGQAVAASRAVITISPNPGGSPPRHPQVFKTVVIVGDRPIDVVAQSPEDVEDVAQRIHEICQGPQKSAYLDLCVPPDGESEAEENLDYVEEDSVNRTKTWPSSTAEKLKDDEKNGAPKTANLRPTIKKTPQTTVTKTVAPSSKQKPTVPSTSKPRAQPTKSQKTPSPSSKRPATSSPSNKPEKAQPTNKAAPKSSSQKPPQQPSKKPSSSTSKKPTSLSSSKKAAEPTAEKKRPSQSFKTTATSKSPSSQSAAKKPAKQSPSKKSGLPSATSKKSASAPSTTKPGARPTISSKARKPLTTAPTSSKKGPSPSSSLVSPSPKGNSTMPKKPLTKTSSTIRSPITAVPWTPKYSPAWNSTKSSSGPTATAPKEQNFVTGKVSLPTTLQTVRKPATKSAEWRLVDILTQGKSVVEAVEGKAAGHGATSTLRSYTAPSPTAQADAVVMTIPEILEKYKEVPYDDEVETLMLKGWGLTQRDELADDEDEDESLRD